MRVSLHESSIIAEMADDELIHLGEALDRLGAIDARKAQVVEMRFFGGLSVEEIAEAMEIGTATVKRDWAMARAWLVRELKGEGAKGVG